MNKMFLSLLIITFSLKIQAQVYINPGVDITDVSIKSAIEFYAKYISEFKGKKLPDFNKYWRRHHNVV